VKVLGMRLLTVLVLALLANRLAGQSAATLSGVVRDRATGLLVAGAQVWVPGTFWGAVSDRHGEFAIPGVHRSAFSLVVRRCFGAVTARRPAAFDPAFPKAITLQADPRPPTWLPMPRPPWLVSTDDPVVEGYYVASWEGHPFFTCTGEFIPAVFPDSIYHRLFAFGLRARDSLYVRGHTRHDDDPDWPRTLSQLIGRVAEVRRPGPADCRQASAR
jgi:hypothetical protein